MVRTTKPGPMSEDDYLALVTRLQQAMAIEPFRPALIDVMLLASEWRMHNTEIERLRAALRTEHFSSNGSSVYMEGPPEHDRSIARCRHPLCIALKRTDLSPPALTVEDKHPHEILRSDVLQQPVSLVHLRMRMFRMEARVIQLEDTLRRIQREPEACDLPDEHA